MSDNLSNLEALKIHNEVIKIASNEYGCKYYYMTNFISWYNLGFLKDIPEIHTMFNIATYAILDYDNCKYSEFDRRWKMFCRLQYVVYCDVKGVDVDGKVRK